MPEARSTSWSTPPGSTRPPPWPGMDAAAWDRVQQVNVRAPMLLTVALAAQAASGSQRREHQLGCGDACPPGRRALLHVQGGPGDADQVCCAVELAATGVRVNGGVDPGFVTVDSPVNPVSNEYRAVVSRNPLGRPGRPDEIGAGRPVAGLRRRRVRDRGR